MNLHQFRYVQEAVRRDLNLTEAAKALHTSQPGVSKAILELEGELGIDIFARHGKRLRRVTEPGEHVVRSIEAILREVANLKRIGDEFAKQDAGTLSIATTHHQARYALPGPIAQFRKRFPKVSIALHQGTPDEVARRVRHEEADVGIATESLETVPDLVTMPCYEWQHVLVVPAGHPLAAVERPTLEQLAAEPLVTYHFAFAGRRRIDAAFQRAGLLPQIALEAIDADVIKTYVRLGLGVGIVAEAAMREESVAGGGTGELVARPLGHLFGSNTTRIAFRKGAYLRNYVYAFAELTSDRLTRALVQRALAGDTSDWVD